MSKIPSGTVTFLFTDIEGSTRLWENFPEQMQVAFQKQEAILRQTFTQHGGYAYKMIGDAFQVAFETAPAAVRAAVEAQQRLSAEAWGETPIRVRMALHTGITEERGDDYVGPALNRLGRLLSASHGNQILLTQATCQLVCDNLPDDNSLRDLGKHRFKDMVEAEHIYQIEAPGLPDDFPPLHTLDTFPHNLPAQLTSFIGRETEMVEIKLLLVVDKYRLVTLTGSGGTGKTRLALQVAANLLDAFADGAWFVELSPLADPALVAQTVAKVVSVRDIPGKPVTNILIDHLRTQHMLLILDNCEHVIEASARLATALLQSCPNLQILATSREIMGIAGEAPYRVPSLSTPNIRQLPPLEQFPEYEAVRLFCERASQSSPGFLLTRENAPLIARICSRLDGIPLAIELAAARVRLLSLEQIAARLADSFRLLTGGSRTALPRHQTLQALIDWSYNLLAPPERNLLARLSVFAGGWMLEAAEEVCGCQCQEDVLSLLVQLVDKSLVLAKQEQNAETRYFLLETIRQYAREKTIDREGREQVRDRHLDYFLRLARQAEPHLRSTDQIAWLDRLEVELDNLRLALEWSLDSRYQDGLQLATVLLWFWHIRGHGNEGMDWLEQLLEAQAQALGGEDGSLDLRLIRAQALSALGFLNTMQGQFTKSRACLTESLGILRSSNANRGSGLANTLLNLAAITDNAQQAQAMYQESLSISRQAGDKFTTAEALQNLGGLMLQQGKFAEARQLLEEDLHLRKQLDDIDGAGTAWMELGEVAFFEGKSAEADAYFANSLECYHKVGNKPLISRILFSQAMAAFSEGDFDLASQKCEQAIAIGHELREKSILAVGLFRLGRLNWAQGNYDLAYNQYQEVVKISREMGFKSIQAWAHFGLARLDIDRADFLLANEHLKEASALWRETKEEWEIGLALVIWVELAYNWQQLGPAAQLLGAAEQLLPSFGLKVLNPVEIKNLEDIRFTVQDRMGEKAFHQAWSAGQQMTVDQILDLVLSLGLTFQQRHAKGSPFDATAGPLAPAYLAEGDTQVEPLTEREREVLQLVAAGSTNQEIASKLYIDVGTVKSHNTHIFTKLGVKNRTQAVTRARRLGLL